MSYSGLGPWDFSDNFVPPNFLLCQFSQTHGMRPLGLFCPQRPVSCFPSQLLPELLKQFSSLSAMALATADIPRVFLSGWADSYPDWKRGLPLSICLGGFLVTSPITFKLHLCAAELGKLRDAFPTLVSVQMPECQWGYSTDFKVPNTPHCSLLSPANCPCLLDLTLCS